LLDLQWLPFGKRGNAVAFEDIAAAEMMIEVEVAADSGRNGGKRLQDLDISKLRRCASRLRN